MQKGIILVIIGLLVLGGVWFVSSRNNSTPEGVIINDDEFQGSVSDDASSESEDALFDISETEDSEAEAKTFTVTGLDFSFSETDLRVSEGDTVRLTFVNDGAMPHDWVLDEFGAATRILQGGEQETIEFVAGDPGVYEFYCSVGNHREMGMVGTLTVE